MKKDLTQQQIDSLFAFCRKHYVRYYDVQIELVDHLANAIEEKLNANNSISFEKALDEVYATFGYKGFAGIVEAKTNALSKQYAKLRWKYFGEYFTIPKILFTLMICTILYALGNIITSPNLRTAVYLIAIAVCIVEVYISYKLSKAIKKSKKEILLLTTSISGQSFIGFWCFQVLINYSTFYKGIEISMLQYWLLSCIIVIYILITIAQRKVNEQIITKAKQDYPLAFE